MKIEGGYSFGFRCEWSDHWSNGGTGVTKTSSKREALELAKSVKDFGDPSVFMKGTELHCTRDTSRGLNLSDFWKFHDTRTGRRTK